ncbi:regulatory protein RepA [mine drainage metagenome]|uniref:Regulatory protein RepA n=1 Tax=mine drainage metagenome TaxID=410659 RepID=A0A1J5R4N7_9ZZZZ
MSALLGFGRPLTIGQAAAIEWPDQHFVLGTLQPGDVGLLSGADGSGKSWVALAAGFSVARGKSFFGGVFEVPPGPGGKVLYIAVEDRYEDHGRRLQALARHVQTHESVYVTDDDDGLTVLALEGRRLPLVRSTARGAAQPYVATDVGQAWAEAIRDYRLVILDPLRACHDLEESDGAGMDYLVRWLVTVAMTNQQVIMLIHHASQGAILDRRDDHHAGRGATDLPAGCRGVWTLRAPTPTEIDSENERRDWRVLINGKASHAPEAQKRFLRRGVGGVFHRAEPPMHEANGKANSSHQTGGANSYITARAKRGTGGASLVAALQAVGGSND